MSIPDNITAAGLTNTEAKLYTALVNLGKAQAGDLSRKTGIHRRSVYDALERLIEKGLVSFIKENEKRFYLAENPQRLIELIDAQRKSVEEVLPALSAQFDSEHEKQVTKFYRGVQGLKSIFDDQVREGQPVNIIGGAKNASDILRYYLGHYTKKRVAKKIPLNILYYGRTKRLEPIPHSKIKFLPAEHASNVSTNIWSDKIAIIVWNEEPIAILIKNSAIADSFKKQFQLLWELAHK